jgi:hypothetical protein
LLLLLLLLLLLQASLMSCTWRTTCPTSRGPR